MSFSPIPSNAYPRMPGGVDPHPIFNDPDIGQVVTSYLYPEQSQEERAGWLTLFNPEELSLECRRIEMISTPVDIYADCGFQDHLSPNESDTHQLFPHLAQMKRGIAVATGAARIIFLFLHTPEGICTALVGRDINSRIKAYNDFFTLLLRVSLPQDQADFLTLWSEESRFFTAQEITSRIAIIRERLHTSSHIPKRMREYYLNHLDDFATIYFAQMHFPDNGEIFPDENDNRTVAYHKNPALFNRLQKLAMQGNMVSTIGDIGDLHFLPGREIAVVDASNIHQYRILDLRGSDPFNPIVIWTQVYAPTVYNSYTHDSLTLEEREEFDSYLRQLTESHRSTLAAQCSALTDFLSSYYFTNSLSEEWITSMTTLSEDPPVIGGCRPGLCYSRATLLKLRNNIATYVEEEE